MSLNLVAISGNVTRDAELRGSGNGRSMLTFGVAVNERRKNPQTGEWENVPNFVDCVVWGNRADAIAQYVTKGTKVAVEGRLRYSSWEKNGERRSKLEVVVDEIEFLSQGQRQQQAPQQQYQQPMQQYQQAPRQQAPQQQYYPNQAPMGYQQPSMPDVYDEDIPFGG